MILICRSARSFKFCKLAQLETEWNRIDKVETKESYLQFQREWSEFKQAAKNEPARVMTDKLNPTQQHKLELLNKHIERLSMNEQRYLVEILRQRAVNKINRQESNMGITEEQLASISEGLWPMAHPKWLLQQEAMAKMWPLGQQGIAKVFSEIIGMSGGSGGAASAAPQEEAPKEVKEEVKAEKLNFDLELSSIDAASKIKIIKEVRQLLNLGLKEAKDLVEKAPAVLQKGVRKEDAEALKEKLEAIGCKITLI